MSLVANAFLSDKSLKIRAKAIPWEGYQRAGLLEPEDVKLVQRVATGTREKAESILDAEGETYAALYIRLLGKLSRTDTIQFILVLLGDFIADRDERILLLLSQSDSPYPPLLKTLESSDNFVRLKSAAIISTVLPYDRSPPNEVVEKVLSILSSMIRSPNEPEAQDVGVQALESVLRVAKARELAWQAEQDGEQSEDGKSAGAAAATKPPKVVEGLVNLLRGYSSPQMQYQLAFCFWLLTFDQTIAEEINARYNLIPLLLDLAKQAIKEKILRVVVSTFRNLVTRAPKQNLAPMLVAKVLPWIQQSMQGRMFSDDEIKDDVDFLANELKSSFDGMTTFDEYKSELASGHLTWSPTHKNDDFWRDNASKLTDKDREQLKVLVHLLMSSTEPLTLAVAANDVAQFVKFHETGKKAIEDLGAKARVMQLMTHADPDVKYQSLLATQRLMSHAWA
ncbi:ATPase, V1 complex, subunit H [Rhodotorula sp. JG-1b]|nr:ATPase, V1 complex, subunit H [Rhodotorula sp. JG-1b]